MRALSACVKKDVRLFFAAPTGVMSLLLPLVLLIAMAFGMEGTVEARTFVAPFSIAVRDEDQTIMSRMLIDQIRRVDLIESVVRADDTPDEALLSDGAAAVLTLPKDFFYALYDMTNLPVTVVLNADTPVEAAIFQNLVSSVMGIISANQSAFLTLNELEYGDAGDAARAGLYAETAESILRDALGRRGAFDAYAAAADAAEAKMTYYAAAVCAMTLLFIPLSVNKVIPEELRLGVLPRFASMGANPLSLFAARLIAAALLSAPPIGLLLLAAGLRPSGALLLTLLLTLLAGFSLFLLIALWTNHVPRAQMIGNVLIIASLIAGGALYPSELLPDAASALGVLTIPYYTLRGFTAARAGAGMSAALAAIWPLAVFSAVCFAACWAAYRGRGRRA